jgi:hypothetical protein
VDNESVGHIFVHENTISGMYEFGIQMENALNRPCDCWVRTTHYIKLVLKNAESHFGHSTYSGTLSTKLP